jgi:hypothetical protein
VLPHQVPHDSLEERPVLRAGFPAVRYRLHQLCGGVAVGLVVVLAAQ